MPLAPALALLAVAASFRDGAPPRGEESPREILTRLIDVLNSKDHARLRAFIVGHARPDAMVDLTVERWSSTADPLAPFTIAGDGKEAADEVDAFATDKDGSRLVFMLHLTPERKLAGLRIAPAYVVEGPDPAYAGWTSVGALAKSIADRRHCPAMGIAVVRDGKEEIGVSGIRKVGGSDAVGPDEVWSIGSIGKSLCSSVVAKLIELGKLRWDETVGEALPDIPMDSGYKSVTLEQIMHHRGGFPADLGFSGAQVNEIVGNATTPINIRARYVKDVLRRAPIAKAGAEFHYSNAGYALLSVIAERAAGKPYEELLHDFVFAPLGLGHSYTDADPLPEDRPSGHVPMLNVLEPHEMEGPINPMLAGAGLGIFMSLHDLAAFGSAHLAGLQGHDGFLKAATVARLHTGIPEIPGGRPYACGWTQTVIPTLQPWDGHNGSDGTMRSEIAIFPSANLVVVGIANAGGAAEPSPGLTAVMAIAQRYAPAKASSS